MGSNLTCFNCNELVDENLEQVRCVRPFSISATTDIQLPSDCKLYQDQTLKQTEGGLDISIQTITIFQMKNYIQNELPTELVMKSIIDHCNIEINKITQNFYITNLGGISLKIIKNNSILTILNATIDLPRIEFPHEMNIESLRVPISVNEPQTLAIYLDDVSDKIQENYLKNKNTLIYCHNGSMNSVALALGNQMKF